ncbi:MAG: hypothetical protein IPJ19_06010 [Planctomycetes bacterium]|nr:hypothetical protein [Planctomycetota bacterium]
MARFAFSTLLAASCLLAAPLTAQVHEAWSTNYPPPSGPPFPVHYGEQIVLGSNGASFVVGTQFVSTFLIPLELSRIEAGGSLTWSRTLSGAFSSSYVGLSPSDGNLVVAGKIAFGGVRVAKFDPAGSLLWEAPEYYGPYGVGQLLELGQGPVFDAAGNVYLCALAATGPGFYDIDALVVSFDSGGQFRFETVIPGAAGLADNADRIAPDGAGAVWVTGYMDGDTHKGASSYLAHITSSGAVAALHVFPAAPGTMVAVKGLEVDSSGRPYLLRRVYTGPQWTSTEVARYDTQGQLAGVFSFAAAAQVPLDFDVSADGRVATTGWLNPNGHSGFTALLDSNLALVWQRDLHVAGPQYFQMLHVLLEPNGDVTSGGQLGWPDSSGNSNNSIRVMRYDSAGGLRWSYAKGEGDGLSQWLRAMQIDASGRLWIAGFVNVPAGGGSVTVHVERLEPQSQSFCLGDGLQLACPCGNDSQVGLQSGCVNSANLSGQLMDSGDASLGNDSLSLSASGELPAALSIFLQGTSAVAPIAFGDGLRCVGGNLKRLYTKSAVAGVATAPGVGDPSVSVRSAALSDPLAPGAVRYFQTYYRDPSQTFCASGGTFNVTNALLLTWYP